MSFVDQWDTGQQGADWDSGLQWDTNVGPNLGDVAPYVALITSEHRTRPNYIAMITAVMQPFADIVANVNLFVALYDIDTAVGEQLDALGDWIGVTRDISVALPNVYFTFDDELLGFDLGTWRGPGDPIGGLVRLPDDEYRTLLRARIANNAWNGSIDDAYTVWNTAFAGTGIGILIQDLGNMHMLLALTGPTPNAVELALLTGGYLNLKPAGVMVDSYVTPSVPDTPFFGFDAQNDSVSGFDTGAWGTLNDPT